MSVSESVPFAAVAPNPEDPHWLQTGTVEVPARLLSWGLYDLDIRLYVLLKWYSESGRHIPGHKGLAELLGQHATPERVWRAMRSLTSRGLVVRSGLPVDDDDGEVTYSFPGLMP